MRSFVSNSPETFIQTFFPFPTDDMKSIDDDVVMEDSTSPAKKVLYDPEKNAHLKGRRRFTADLSNIQEACAGGLVVNGLMLKRTFSSSSAFHSHDRQNRGSAWR
jgi:hypothetical protein